VPAFAFFRHCALCSVVALLLGSTQSEAAVPGTVTVNAGRPVTGFVPWQVFGSNVSETLDVGDLLDLQPTLQNMGDRYFRFPGGSDSDNYHWNGTGSYVNGIWVPDGTAYTPGFLCEQIYNCTNAVDGLTGTAWVSDSDTAFPSSQWLYVDFGGNTTVDTANIVWGTPYAASFQVQAWDPNYSDNQWAPYLASANAWLGTSAGTVSGTGGSQTVTFTPVTTRYMRILMTSSSAGLGGAYSVAELSFSGQGNLLSPSQNSFAQNGVVSSSQALANGYSDSASLDFDGFMTFCNAFQPTATPLITVNFGTGTPQEAAAWVHYANIVRGYHIRYWELGNEMNGYWESGGPLNALDYAHRYLEFRDAMTAVDPSIVLFGPVCGPPDPSNNLDNNTYIADFAQALVNAGRPSALGGISVHIYPNWDSEDETALLATPSEWDDWGPAMTAALSSQSNPSAIPILLSETNADSAGTVINARLADGLWYADWVGRYLKNFGARSFVTFFTLMGAEYEQTDPTQGAYGQFEQAPGPYQYQPSAACGAAQLMSEHWAIPGDTRTHTLVSSTASVQLLSVYSDLRPDGTLVSVRRIHLV
jgi:hypothetical protein